MGVNPAVWRVTPETWRVGYITAWWGTEMDQILISLVLFLSDKIPSDVAARPPCTGIIKTYLGLDCLSLNQAYVKN